MRLDEKQVQEALGSVDPDLFLDKRWSGITGVYYCVCYPAPGEPLVVVDWRDGVQPRPLSLDIVDQVRRQEGDIREAISRATAHNAARKELLRQERLKETDNIIEEWQKSGRSTGIPKDSYMIVPKDLPKPDV
jgi:hypothetical protein